MNSGTWLIDYGNSALKMKGIGAAGTDAPIVISRIDFEKNPQDLMMSITMAEWSAPHAVIAACARKQDENALAKFLSTAAPRAKLQLLTASSGLPFRILYRDGSPGPDRIAAAFALRKNADQLPSISVDFGTATNIVVVDANGDFAGGSIMPGIALQFASLNTATDGRLPLVSPDEKLTAAIGDSTNAAILAGVLIGHAGAVDRLIEEMERELGATINSVAITGGGAKLIAKWLRRKVDHRPNLVLEGLKEFAITLRD
ncbi:hypothetical protein BH09SUM1_BH09SUM1_24120 [soil metagenome]